MLAVRSAAPSAIRPPYEWPTTSTGTAGLARDRVDDRGEVVELALDRVAARRPAQPDGAAAAAVDRVEPVPCGQERAGRPPGRVVGGRAVDEDRAAARPGRKIAMTTARIRRRRRGRRRGAAGRRSPRPARHASSGRAPDVADVRLALLVRAEPSPNHSATKPLPLVEPAGAVVDLERVEREAVRSPLLREIDEPAARCPRRAGPARRRAGRSRRRRRTASRRPARRPSATHVSRSADDDVAEPAADLVVGVGERERRRSRRTRRGRRRRRRPRRRRWPAGSRRPRARSPAPLTSRARRRLVEDPGRARPPGELGRQRARGSSGALEHVGRGRPPSPRRSTTTRRSCAAATSARVEA